LPFCSHSQTKNKTPSAPPVYLNVLIEELFDSTTGAAIGIRPDVTGRLYQNGLESVSASFNQYGHFVFLSGSRSITFDYSSRLLQGLGDGTATVTGSETWSDVSTRSYNTGTPYTLLQSMYVGQSQCIGVGWHMKLGDAAETTRSVGFRYGRGTLENTAYVVISHTDQNTWVMEPTPQGVCNGDATYDSSARVRDSKTVKGKTVDTDYGRYRMPFRLILTRQ
jgi:hypothetical protein